MTPPAIEESKSGIFSGISKEALSQHLMWHGRLAFPVCHSIRRCDVCGELPKRYYEQTVHGYRDGLERKPERPSGFLGTDYPFFIRNVMCAHCANARGLLVKDEHLREPNRAKANELFGNRPTIRRTHGNQVRRTRA